MRQEPNGSLPARGLTALLALIVELGSCSIRPDAGSDVGVPRADAGRLWILVENDFFLFREGTDGSATNALRLEWELPAWRDPAGAKRHAPELPWFPDAPSETSISVFLGQSIFTPIDISDTGLRPDERPYSGWLYGGFAVQTIAFDESDRWADRLDRIEAQFGIVGPSSQAEELQEALHRWTKSREPRGWQHQLEDEFGVNLVYNRANRVFRSGSGLQVDGIANFGASLGNVSTYAASGLIVRLGWDLPRDFGIPTVDRFMVGGRSSRSFHAFVAVEGRAVARNIFLDGNTFRDSHEVDTRPFIAELRLGAVVPLGPVELSVVYVLRTPDYREQSEALETGMVMLSFDF